MKGKRGSNHCEKVILLIGDCCSENSSLFCHRKAVRFYPENGLKQNGFLKFRAGILFDYLLNVYKYPNIYILYTNINVSIVVYI